MNGLCKYSVFFLFLFYSCTKKIIRISVIFLLLLPINNVVSGFLHTEGRDIADSNNNPILLKGIGLGGWLVPEGYMLHIPGFGSPTSIRNMILELIGEDNTEQFYEIYTSNYVNEYDIKKIAEWGFNSIRLPFNYRLLSPESQPGVFLEEGFQVIDSTLSWCKGNNLYLILDMHCAPGGQNPDNISDSNGEARLWTESANQSRTVAIWREIARRYADEEWIGGFDLLNEPVLPKGHSNAELRNLYMRITNAIREVDNNHIIFIEGSLYATDFNDLIPPFDGNMVYSFHKYWNENSIGSISQYVNIRNSFNIPLWMGESGENSNTWFYNCRRLLEDNNIGWCWWTHKKVKTTTSPLSSSILPPYQLILDYWNGQADRPSSDFAQYALNQMAENLVLEKCECRLGVIPSLFDDGFGEIPKPFKNHEVPGTVKCVDYDFGTIDVAYSDTDFERTYWDWSVSQPWNIGGKYRNDGVDIERSENLCSDYYNVGWIEDNEWLKYTVNITKTSAYDITFKVSSINSTGKFKILVNDESIAEEISVPNTGGWQNWQEISIASINLTEGIKIITLRFTKGEFNIYDMKFTLSNDTLDQGPNRFNLDIKIYPNPFNNKTRIEYYIPQKSMVTIEIYDTLGRLIDIPLMREMEQGKQSIEWGDATLNSGIYFCQIECGNIEEIKKFLLLR